MKKQKRTRLAALLMAIAMVASALAACNGGTESSVASADSGSVGSSSASSAAEEVSEEVEESSDASVVETNTDPSGEMTEVGTPREDTLIVEMQNPTDVPGQFNTYIQSTPAGTGIHQMMSAMMWEIDTVKGEQFCEVAAEFPESNEDFTEHIVKIREGIKWSDGEDLDAHDVAFTFNMIIDNPGIVQSGYFNSVFESVEATDDYTVKLVTKESFPRLALKFGVTIWGYDLRIVPEHIYAQQADVTQFKDENPVVAGPYTVKEYDNLGKWILFERREDWENSTVGVVTGKMPQAPYVLFKVLGDDTTRQMALINNEVDLMVEVTPEMIEVMSAQNPNISAWYNGFPYATSDDPCSKGLSFMMAKAPYDNPDFRWAIALAMNFDEVSVNIFDGIGRSSPFPILTATTAMMDLYYLPLAEWAKDFELDLGDGTKMKPFDPEYATRMAATMSAQGYDIPTDEAGIIDMFGVGCWKHDPEAAEKLLIKAGLEKKDDGWYFEGQPFTINLTYIADTEVQAARGVNAAFDQLTKFGLNCNITSESQATWTTNDQTGNFDIGGYWPTGGITKDIYDQIQGFANDLIVPVGEIGSGQGSRWDNDEATAIIHEMAKLSPDSEESYELGMEFMKIAIADMPFLGFHSGVKFVPTNTSYWMNYPNAENPYNGPWWWWSCFKYILTEITPAA